MWLSNRATRLSPRSIGMVVRYNQRAQPALFSSIDTFDTGHYLGCVDELWYISNVKSCLFDHWLFDQEWQSWSRVYVWCLCKRPLLPLSLFHDICFQTGLFNTSHWKSTPNHQVDIFRHSVSCRSVWKSHIHTNSKPHFIIYNYIACLYPDPAILCRYSLSYCFVAHIHFELVCFARCSATSKQLLIHTLTHLHGGKGR